MGMPFVLVSLSNKVDLNKADYSNHGLKPRQDYIEITKRLGGNLPGRDIINSGWYKLMKPLEQKLKLDLSLATYVAANSSNDQVILSASEKIAIPLAMWLVLKKHRPRHVVIGHKLSTGAKAGLLRSLPFNKYYDAVICLCRSQARYAVEHMEMPVNRVHFIYDKVDEQFFRPEPCEPGDYILAVGQEQRDYPTLVKAVEGLNKKLVIVASSPWSSYQIEPQWQENITILKNLSYVELRKLYNQACIVVVPIQPADYAAGANGVLEGMAMAKPMIVAKTEGIQDYIEDGETGLYFNPGDAGDLREKINQLYTHPQLARHISLQARAVVEKNMNMDRYVEEISQIVLNSTRQ